MMETQRLTFREKFFYGLGDSAANILATLSGTFLTAYYTDTVGIAAATIGTMMLISRILDGGTDILAGMLVDKTSTRWGKARPWLLWTAPFMALALILLFHVPQNAGQGTQLAYIYFTYIFQNCIVYTACNLPYNALLARMTLNVQDRASTTAIRFVMASLSMLLVSALTSALLPTVGWGTLSVAYGLAEMVLLLLCFFGVREHLDVTDTGRVEVVRVPLKVSFAALLKNRYFFLLTILYCLIYLLAGCIGTAGYFYCNIVLGNMAMVTVLSAAQTIPQLIMCMVMPGIVRKVGKQKMLLGGTAVLLLGSVLIGAAGTRIPLVILGTILRGLAMGTVFSGVFALTADVVDYGEWKTGIRSEGLISSCTSFGMKVGIGIGSALCTWILAFGGYEGTASVQTASAITSIRVAFGYSAAVVCALCLVICAFLNTDQYLGVMEQNLRAKHQK